MGVWHWLGTGQRGGPGAHVVYRPVHTSFTAAAVIMWHKSELIKTPFSPPLFFLHEIGQNLSDNPQGNNQREGYRALTSGKATRLQPVRRPQGYKQWELRRHGYIQWEGCMTITSGWDGHRAITSEKAAGPQPMRRPQDHNQWVRRPQGYNHLEGGRTITIGPQSWK